MQLQRLKPLVPLLGLLVVIAIVLVLSLNSRGMGGAQAPAAPSDAANPALMTGEGAPPPPMMEYQDEERGAVPMATAAPAMAPGAQGNQQSMQRMVIKTADVRLEVADVSEVEQTITGQIGQLGGYVVEVQTSGTGKDLYSSITFRVPADRFDEALRWVQGFAKRVLSRTVGGQDVTEEFVDLDARVRNLEVSRDRLLNLMNQATNVEDALYANQALTDIQGQIEQIRGRMQYLQQSAAMSTFTVALQPEFVEPLVQDDSWQPLVVARDALRSMIALGQMLINGVIVGLVWSPVWLPLVVAGLWYRRKRRGQPGSGSSVPPASV